MGGELEMTARENIKILLIKENKTLVALAQILTNKFGKKVTADGLSQKLRKGTMRYDEVEKIAEALGYKINFEKI